MDRVVLPRLGGVLGTGAGWKDILDNGHHTLTHSHTHIHTHQISYSSNNRDNTVTLALFKAKPRLGPDYSHDLRAGMMITLLP